MTSWKLPLYKIYSDDEDIQLIKKVLSRGSHWAIGPEIEEFESELKNYLGVDYVVSLNSGTSALHAALLAYGIGKNDEIITSSFSFISTANAALFVGAKPVFSDIETETYGLDPLKIQSCITSNTKAILPMDYGGSSCKIFDILDIAHENNLFLIEDAAESLGSKINNKKVGTISDSSIFSFCGNKIISTGEGGALVTNSKTIYEKVKLIRSHGRQESKSFFDDPNIGLYTELGYNWRMSSITAALGISQLKKLDKIIKLRQENAKFISEKLKRFSQIKTPISDSNSEHIFQLYTIRLETKNLRDELSKFLSNKGIFSKIYFSPIHLSSFYQKKFNYKTGDLPITEQVSDKVLTLPLYSNMTQEEKLYLTDSISEYFESINK